ncbi:MAG: hypothetical protein L6R38_001333 [Xanthoria sp. 2 TBL-2021]|nr:MAG: hypothetical protein L6R38_001333 [Xanthoria sp. 2 TBL-2021]
MRLFSLALLFASTSILAPLSLCAGPIIPDLSLQPGAAPLHVPICEPQAGRFDLYVCARLLSALKNLPYYQQRQIWSEYTRGEGHLPAVFSLSDRSRQRQCFLTMDLYEPGVPLTAKETFSLREEQHEFNNIYFECLKAKGLGGFNRIGFLGNIAAFLGPRVDLDNPLLANFRSLSANNGTGINKVSIVDVTDLADS